MRLWELNMIDASKRTKQINEKPNEWTNELLSVGCVRSMYIYIYDVCVFVFMYLCVYVWVFLSLSYTIITWKAKKQIQLLTARKSSSRSQTTCALCIQSVQCSLGYIYIYEAVCCIFCSSLVLNAFNLKGRCITILKQMQAYICAPNLSLGVPIFTT